MMFTYGVKKKQLLRGMIGSLLFMASVSFGAPGTIKDRPLFLGFSVQPNIYFVVDDSGSMGWGVTKTTEAKEVYPYNWYSVTYPTCYTRYNKRNRYVTSSQVPNCPDGDLEWKTTDLERLYRDRNDIEFSPIKATSYWSFDHTIYDLDMFYAANSQIDEQGYVDEFLLETCSGYNATAYDPTLTYSPWHGYDDSTASLSGHGYIPWIDANNNDVFDSGECSARYADRVLFDDLSTSTSEVNTKKNYRNWYTYYRERTHVAKKAISEVIAGSDARMGLATINRGQYYSVQDMKVASNKSSLLNQLFSVPASGGTPLRTALKSAGEYFKGSNSPIQSEDDGGSCQQNYAILMTDGYWNGSSPEVGNVDGTSSHSLVRASDRDGYSSTLADVAMKYYATDLKTSLANEVPIIAGKDENEAQHLVTFTVAFGVNGQIEPYDTTSGRETDSIGMPLNPDRGFAWPKPSSSTDSTIDDVRHAAWNGRGLYLNAKNPQGLIDSLEASIDEIESRTGTASALAFNSTSFRTDSKFYYAQFTSGSWGGELIAQELSNNLEAGAIQWEATTVLDSKSPNSRTILTYDNSLDKAVAFRSSSLPAAQYADLKSLYDSKYKADPESSGPFSSESQFVSAAVDYLRGDRSREGASFGQFRNRSTALGDIINSTPVYVSGPASNWPAFIEPGYITYMRSIASRAPVLYVGANDGMMHAFSAENGEELFAYVPYGVASTVADEGLHYLVDQDYNHRYYVDGTMGISDAYINGSWKTILVGGLGAGGKTLFALDVTNPTSVTESGASSTVLWEVDLPDLGLTYPQAKVAKMNDGTWVAIVGNGYHNTTDGRAKIFVLDLATGALLKTFDSGIGALTSGNCLDTCNGMSKVTIRDLDGNGTVDFIYAGDVLGNIWAINTNSAKRSEWVFDSQVNYLDGIAISYSGSSVDPIFVTEDNRPITTELVVVDNPALSSIKTWPNQLLFVGSGQFIAEGDHESTATEHVYAFSHMNGQYELSVSNNPTLFAERVIKNPSGDTSLRYIEPKVASEATFEYGYTTTASGVKQKMGWYLPLPSSGERVIHDPLLVSEYVIFNTLIPESDPCKFGASGFTMAISLLYGANPEVPILDFNNDGTIDYDDKDLAGYELSSPPAGLTKLGNKGLGQSTFEEPEFELLNLYGNSPNRLSWEDMK